MHRIPYQILKNLRFPFEVTSRGDWMFVLLAGLLVSAILSWGSEYPLMKYILPPSLIVYYFLCRTGDRKILSDLRKELLDPHAGNSEIWDVYYRKIAFPPRGKQAMSLSSMDRPLDLYLLGRLIQCHARKYRDDEDLAKAEAILAAAKECEPSLRNYDSQENLGEIIRQYENGR